MVQQDRRRAGQVFDTQADRISIGRGADNDIVLDSPFVAETAAIIAESGSAWELTPAGENEILLGSQALHPGERVLIGGEQPIQIFPFSLSLEPPATEGLSEVGLREALQMQGSRLILDVHRELLERMDTSESEEQRGDNEEYLMSLENDLEEIARLQGFLKPEYGALLAHFSASTIQAELLHRTIETSAEGGDVWASDGRWLRMFSAVADFESELDALVERVAAELDLPAIEDLSRKIEAVDRGFWDAWGRLSGDLYPEVVQYLALRYLKKQIKDIVFGYGPLEDLLRMPNISEIMVVDREKIYIEKNGVLEKSGRRFVSDKVTESIIERIVSRVGRRIDRSQPLVDARLTDGSRVNAVISPLAISGPCLTIRKFPHSPLRMDDLVACGSLTRTVAEFLRASVTAKCNILISGGTGSGKTTLLNCLSNFIPDKERIVTIEDTAELQLQKDHVVRMETKSANVEGVGEYSIRDLVRNALRMRPDRVVVGECRGAEALDMLQAMNTGHDGSMTTIHANNADDVILRLEVLVQMAAELPIDSIHRQVASAIDLIVQLTRMRDGSRRVSQVMEIIGYDAREKAIRTKDLFLLVDDDEGGENDENHQDGAEDAGDEDGEGEETDKKKAGGELMPTGALPTFMDKLIESELIDLEAFYL